MPTFFGYAILVLGIGAPLLPAMADATIERDAVRWK